MRLIDSTTEIHHVLLEIGKEFHRICQKHNIPYIMLGGTMLGAVRHGGFIPWDDDMDFGVPRDMFDEMKKVLIAELPEYYRVITLEDSDAMISDIIKIEDTRTVIAELYKENSNSSLGLNIDIFPLDEVNLQHINKIKRALMLRSIHYYRFLSLEQRTGGKRVLAIIIKLLLCGINRKSLPRFIRRILSNTNHGSAYANIYGAWGIKEVVDKNILFPAKLYDFNGIQMWGVKNPHAYLSQLYNNYMELPPEDKRHLHVINCYMK